MLQDTVLFESANRKESKISLSFTNNLYYKSILKTELVLYIPINIRTKAFIKIQKSKRLKKSKIRLQNVAGSVGLSLFMDGSNKCNLLSILPSPLSLSLSLSLPPSSGLSRIQHLKMFIVNVEF